jgi:hypothetical protein
VASGLGVVLVSSGDAGLYRREDVVTRPVTGIAPSELAVVRRRHDTRPAVATFVRGCVRCLCPDPLDRPQPE